MINQIKKRGFSLIEIIIYLAIFSFISIVVINSFIVTVSAFQVTKTNRNLQESGSTSMERISREIRQAKTINSADGSILSLVSSDSLGNERAVEFKLGTGGVLNLYEAGVLVDNLLSSNIVATSLIFNQIITKQGEAVKIEMIIEDTKSKEHKSAKFYNTIILRGEYQ